VQSASLVRVGGTRLLSDRASTSASGITVPTRKTSMKAPTGVAAR
jgi:hypothetical protein